MTDPQVYLQQYAVELSHELRQAADRFMPGPPELDLMLRYHLGWVDAEGNPTGGKSGKQVRPMLLLLCAEIAGSEWRKALPAAAAIELIHNFSLIHDDIEDNSPLRRGRDTVWKIWGMATAINAGDAMFALAHQELWRLTETGVPAPQVLEAYRIFEQTNLALTRGQHLDMTFETRSNVAVNEYMEMIGGKSAALIATSAQLGAVIASLPPEESQRYADFGRNLGLAFQIRDDILGIWGDPEKTGKSAATDIISRKKSLPILYGLGHSPELAHIYEKPHEGEEELARAVAILDSLEARKFAVDYETRFTDNALSFFDQFQKKKKSVSLEVLKGLVYRLLEREA